MADSSKKMQIVFASAECAPFVKTGGLGDVAGSLPAALVRAGAEVIVMVPKYATIKDEYKAQMEHFSDFYVSLGWRNEYCGLEKLEHDGVTYMFIDNERYFARDYPYGFFDDGERFAFFSKAITESPQHPPAVSACLIPHSTDRVLSGTSCTAMTGRRHWRPCSCASSTRAFRCTTASRPCSRSTTWRSRASLATP